MPDALLEVENLTTRYPVRRGLTERVTRQPRLWVHAVDGVSFTLARGEMLALVGESGCGKTTTAQTILGMVAPDSGTVRLNGTDIAGLPERQMRPLRRQLQMIYQDPYEPLDPRFRVETTVGEPMLVHGIGGSQAERRELIVAALERAGLSPAEALVQIQGEPTTLIVFTLEEVEGGTLLTVVESGFDAIPEPRKKATRGKGALKLSDLMPVERDFAFVVVDELTGTTRYAAFGRRQLDGMLVDHAVSPAGQRQREPNIAAAAGFAFQRTSAVRDVATSRLIIATFMTAPVMKESL